jgi:hypothetical protein
MALTDAKKACDFSSWKNGYPIRALAAAYAESGDFPNAIKWEERAIELATLESEKQQWRELLELFKQGKPYRTDLKK